MAVASENAEVGDLIGMLGQPKRFPLSCPGGVNYKRVMTNWTTRATLLLTPSGACNRMQHQTCETVRSNDIFIGRLKTLVCVVVVRLSRMFAVKSRRANNGFLNR